MDVIAFLKSGCRNDPCKMTLSRRSKKTEDEWNFEGIWMRVVKTEYPDYPTGTDQIFNSEGVEEKDDLFH